VGGTQGPSRAGGRCLSAHREQRWHVARTHGRCAAAHRDGRRRQARSTLGVLEAVLKFLPEDAKSAKSASINWRLIVTFGSSVVHLRITLDP
jgi:hypothetical protein